MSEYESWINKKVRFCSPVDREAIARIYGFVDEEFTLVELQPQQEAGQQVQRTVITQAGRMLNPYIEQLELLENVRIPSRERHVKREDV